MEIKTFLLITLGLFTLISVALFYHDYMTNRNKLIENEKKNKELESTVNSLQERVKKLEIASRKRMPYHSYDKALDAMAALDALEHAEDFRQTLIQNAKAHLIESLKVGTKEETGS